MIHQKGRRCQASKMPEDGFSTNRWEITCQSCLDAESVEIRNAMQNTEEELIACVNKMLNDVLTSPASLRLYGIIECLSKELSSRASNMASLIQTSLSPDACAAQYLADVKERSLRTGNPIHYGEFSPKPRWAKNLSPTCGDIPKEKPWNSSKWRECVERENSILYTVVASEVTCRSCLAIMGLKYSDGVLVKLLEKQSSCSNHWTGGLSGVCPDCGKS